MGRPSIPLIEVKELADKGLGVREIARKLGFTPAGISKALKRINCAVAEQTASHYAGEIVEGKINALQQLQKINDYANELLDLLMRWNQGDGAALQILESQLKKIRVGKTEKFIERAKFKDPRDLALKCMREIRGQLNLQLEIFKVLYDVQAIHEFQKCVIEAIGDVEPDVRDRIIHNLKKAKAVRSALNFD